MHRACCRDPWHYTWFKTMLLWLLLIAVASCMLLVMVSHIVSYFVAYMYEPALPSTTTVSGSAPSRLYRDSLLHVCMWREHIHGKASYILLLCGSVSGRDMNYIIKSSSLSWLRRLPCIMTYMFVRLCLCLLVFCDSLDHVHFISFWLKGPPLKVFVPSRPIPKTRDEEQEP